jgi:hypothetical protein
MTLRGGDIPPSFGTTSRVILIANEWRTLNPNVRALEDRAIILHFDPSNSEVHRRVGEWFQDQEVYEFIARALPSISAISMRHYCKASQLRQAGFGDWRTSLLQMVYSDARMACVVALQNEPTLHSEKDRVERFAELTGYSRATYFRIKARLTTALSVIDPHGDLIDRLLDLLPESVVDRTIYFDPGDPDWVPIWNPFTRIPGQDLGQTADDLVSAFKSFVTGWGDRLERLLRECFYALLHLPGSSLLDVSTVLSNTSDDSKRLCKRILDVITGEEPRRFWRDDFEKYRKDDLGPPKNKLSKLLVGERIPLIFSQPDSLFNLREIMDKGMILLVDLSKIGSEVRGVLGSLMLSLVFLSAISRRDTPVGQRKSFHLFCDEAHRFMTDALDDLISETRKYGVSLTLAHQYMGQFGSKRGDALSSTGSTIIFNVNQKDARHLSNDLRGLVKPVELVKLGKFEAVLRTATEITRFNTPPYTPIKGRSNRDRIIAESHRRYYRKSTEVRRAIRTRHWNQGIPHPSFEGEPEFVYEQF